MIPKKLNPQSDYLEHMNDKAYVSDLVVISNKINQIISYLQAKEEASKGECICKDKNNPHTHLVVCPVHGILNHYSNSNPPEHEESKGECGIDHKHNYGNCCAACLHGEHPSEGSSGHVKTCKYYKPQLKEESPKEDEREQWQCDLAILMGKMVGPRYAGFDEPLEDFIKERLVSKEKIKREIDKAHNENDPWEQLRVFEKSLGLGD